jgi:hypothetical protein
MHKSATKCNETLGKWCKNKHGASKIIDKLETYQSLKVENMQNKEICFMVLKPNERDCLKTTGINGKQVHVLIKLSNNKEYDLIN